MIIKGVGIGRGVAVGPVIRMAQPLPEPSDAPRAEGIAAESEIARVDKDVYKRQGYTSPSCVAYTRCT